MGMNACAWLRNPRLAALLLTVSTTTPAQTIDTTTAHVVIGEPVSLVIRVRAFDLPAGQIRPECLSLKLQQGDSGLAIAPLQLQITPSGDDSTALVRATSPEVITDPFITGRLALNCGAEYVREFTVLTDPPRPPARPLRNISASSHQSDHSRGKRNHSPVHPAAVEGAPSAPLIKSAASDAPRSITRAEEPMPTTRAERPGDRASGVASPVESPASGTTTLQGARTPEAEAQVQALAQAVLQTLQAQGRAIDLPSPPSFAGTAASSPAEMLLPWQELRDEQRLTRATLAALQARLERTERDVWRDALVAMAVMVGLAMSMLLARVAREWALPRFMSEHAGAPAMARTSRRWGDDDDFNDPGRISPPATVSTSTAPAPTVPSGAGVQAAPDMTVSWSPSLFAGGPATSPKAPPLDNPSSFAATTTDPGSDSQWPDADFGRPSLGDSLASIELLQELDTHTDSCPVGCVVVLESRLQENSGKCPWILLRLLDLYQQLEQPWNRVRVAAQLETLYNVRLEADANAEAAEPPQDLAALPGTMDEVQRAWRQTDPIPALSSLLLRPTLVEVLSRAAFEEVLLLLTITHRHSVTGPDATPNTGSNWSDSASVVSENRTAPEQPGPLELLAA